eukprot:g8299.t1
MDTFSAELEAHPRVAQIQAYESVLLLKATLLAAGDDSAYEAVIELMTSLGSSMQTLKKYSEEETAVMEALKNMHFNDSNGTSSNASSVVASELNRYYTSRLNRELLKLKRSHPDEHNEVSHYVPDFDVDPWPILWRKGFNLRTPLQPDVGDVYVSNETTIETVLGSFPMYNLSAGVSTGLERASILGELQVTAATVGRAVLRMVVGAGGGGGASSTGGTSTSSGGARQGAMGGTSSSAAQEIIGGNAPSPAAADAAVRAERCAVELTRWTGLVRRTAAVQETRRGQELLLSAKKIDTRCSCSPAQRLCLRPTQCGDFFSGLRSFANPFSKTCEVPCTHPGSHGVAPIVPGCVECDVTSPGSGRCHRCEDGLELRGAGAVCANPTADLLIRIECAFVGCLFALAALYLLQLFFRKTRNAETAWRAALHRKSCRPQRVVRFGRDNAAFCPLPVRLFPLPSDVGPGHYFFFAFHRMVVFWVVAALAVQTCGTYWLFGPQEQVGPEFARIWKFATFRGVDTEAEVTVGDYYSDMSGSAAGEAEAAARLAELTERCRPVYTADGLFLFGGDMGPNGGQEIGLGAGGSAAAAFGSVNETLFSSAVHWFVETNDTAADDPQAANASSNSTASRTPTTTSYGSADKAQVEFRQVMAGGLLGVYFGAMILTFWYYQSCHRIGHACDSLIPSPRQFCLLGRGFPMGVDTEEIRKWLLNWMPGLKVEGVSIRYVPAATFEPHCQRAVLNMVAEHERNKGCRFLDESGEPRAATGAVVKGKAQEPQPGVKSNPHNDHDGEQHEEATVVKWVRRLGPMPRVDALLGYGPVAADLLPHAHRLSVRDEQYLRP